MTISIGIIDEPVAPGATDNLDINIHSKSLIDFIPLLTFLFMLEKTLFR
jgi:hypothetical protein